MWASAMMAARIRSGSQRAQFVRLFATAGQRGKQRGSYHGFTLLDPAGGLARVVRSLACSQLVDVLATPWASVLRPPARACPR
jgi:hypothetical protein